jgi:serine/threonine-protein kinase HipA
MNDAAQADTVQRSGLVYVHDVLAGRLTELRDGTFRFRYLATYLARPDATAVSLTLPLRDETYRSDSLFAYFQGLLSEGSTRNLQCRMHKVDPNDAFGLLLATGADAIGAVSVEVEP